MILHELLIHDDIPQLRFACDLHRCHGACCTAPGGRGAPLTEEEASLVMEAYPIVKHLLPEAHRDIIDRDGCVERNGGTPALRCHNQRACVFVMFREGIALCALQHAWQEGRLTWPKPISCHLFPIRRSGRNGTRLTLEFFDACEGARELGRETDTYLVDFLDEPLRRALGEEMTAELQHRSRVLRASHEGESC